MRENTDPEVIAAQGKFAHDLRLVLVDENAHVRGYYRVMDAQMGAQEYERLKVDVQLLIDEKD